MGERELSSTVCHLRRRKQFQLNDDPPLMMPHHGLINTDLTAPHWLSLMISAISISPMFHWLRCISDLDTTGCVARHCVFHTYSPPVYLVEICGLLLVMFQGLSSV